MSVEVIKEQAYQTNDLITSYILLHNSIIKSTSLLKSIFRKVDFEEPYQQSKAMLKHFQNKKKELYELHNRLNKTIDKDKKKYLARISHQYKNSEAAGGNFENLRFLRRCFHYQL